MTPPTAVAADFGAGEVSVAARGAHCAQVLVVDDERGIRDLLKLELSDRGYHVVEASDGRQALAALAAQKFQVVVSDVRMPNMDGLTMLHAIKKIDPDVEVIMATGHATIDVAVKAMKEGAYDFVEKPFNVTEIAALIEKALEKNELRAVVAVYEASKALFSRAELSEVLPRIAALTRGQLAARDATIALLRPGGAPEIAAADGISDPAVARERLGLVRSFLSRLAAGEPMVLPDPRPGAGFFLVHPMSVNGEALGAVVIARETTFTRADLRIATIFSSQLAQAVANVRLYGELKKKVADLNESCERLENTRAQLVQTEKLAAIGQLAAGVAHELNNPLTGILGFSQLLLEDASLTARQREDLESIQQQSQRCRRIIQNLLQFSRREVPRRDAVRGAALVESSLQLVKYDFATSCIVLANETPPGLPDVFVDRAQMQQVFVNLLTNARQALEGREEKRITVRGEERGDSVVFTIEDTGCGIAPENIDKLFDPFFTTKPSGKGTGLGLSISYGIVKQHGGTLTVRSEPDKGTAFTLELPRRRP